jgi:hypothetical protein
MGCGVCMTGALYLISSGSPFLILVRLPTAGSQMSLRNISFQRYVAGFQDNWALIKDGTVHVWDNYLKKPATYLWNEIFLKLIWEPAVGNLTKIKNGEPDDIRSNAPVIQTPQPIPN